MKKIKLNPQSLITFLVVIVVSFAVGYFTNSILANRHKNIRVWAVDNTVKIPSGLQSYLESNDENDCKGYRGTDSPTGVSLFAVEKVVGENYVKMSYGCSDNLNQDTYIIAIKQNSKWSLIQPVEYNNGQALPYCAALEKYHISKAAEPECRDAKGSTKQNSVE